MAVQVSSYCIRCKKDFTTTVNSGAGLPNLCDDCKQEEIDREKEIYFLQLDKLSIEARLRKIEEWIYDYEQNKNLFCHPMIRKF